MGWLKRLSVFLGVASALFAADSYQITIQGVTYSVTRKLGSGAVGTVYAATDPTGKKVAIKILDAEFDREMAAIEKQRELEKTQAKGLTVGVVAGGKVDRYQTSSLDTREGIEFRSILSGAKGAVVMERVDGNLEDIAPFFRIGGSNGQTYSFRAGELGQRVDHGFSLAVQMGDLWSGLVQKGYLYTDFKPINVGFEGIPPKMRLLDLGSLATGPIDANSPLDMRNLLVGTSDFRPPEMLPIKRGQSTPGQVYNHYSDYFAIGRTLLQMYCGQCTPAQFEEMIFQYAKKFNGPESQAVLAKMVFMAEFIKASQHPQLADRQKAIAESPILRKYFDMSLNTGPRARLNEAEVIAASLAALPDMLAKIEGRVRARPGGGSSPELPVTKLLALPGESHPEVEPGRSLPSSCSPQLRMLPYVAGALTVGVLAGWQITREKDGQKTPKIDSGNTHSTSGVPALIAPQNPIRP